MTYKAITLFVGLLLVGCGSPSRVQEIRDLRLSGDPDSARSLALSRLADDPSRKDVWLEFAYTSLDLSRRRDDEEAGDPLRPLIEVGIMCGAIYRRDARAVPRNWRDVARLTASAVGREISGRTGELNAQSQTAGYLKQLIGPEGDTLATRRGGTEFTRMVAKYQSGARQMLYTVEVLRRLVELLPDVGGMAAVIIGQSEEAQAVWIASLSLEAEFVTDVAGKARSRVDMALQRAMTDLDQLGYFVPGTIIDNEILP